MSALSFRPASEYSSTELAELFTRGYEGYAVPVALSAADFENMVITNDLDLAASCVAVERGAPVAFALLGVRGAHGWVGGMGVVAAERGRGYGRQAMEQVMAAARERGVRELDLEVLEQNQHAASIYQALGFRDRRWLDVWAREPGALPERSAPASGAAVPEEIPLTGCLELHGQFHAVRSPWQRDLESLRHWGARLSALGVRDARGVRGWVIYRAAETRIGIADLAAASSHDIQPVAAALASLIAARPGASMMLINLPPDDAFAPELDALGAIVKMRQREMTIAL